LSVFEHYKLGLNKKTNFEAKREFLGFLGFSGLEIAQIKYKCQRDRFNVIKHNQNRKL
jgi:hypothetical protein